jgi:AhpD family alkylhydroperoxidase
MSSEVCCFPSSRMRGAERRQALGCSGTLSRANDAGPQALARRLASHADKFTQSAHTETLASRRSTAGFLAPVQRGMRQPGFTVCELLASAPSGGGLGSGASRELLARQCAGRRIPLCPCDASRRAPSSERDTATIVGSKDASNESGGYARWTVGKPLMQSARKMHKRCRIRATRIHRNVGAARMSASGPLQHRMSLTAMVVFDPPQLGATSDLLLNFNPRHQYGVMQRDGIRRESSHCASAVDRASHSPRKWRREADDREQDMSKDFAEIAHEVMAGVGLLQRGVPDTMKAFGALSTAATASKAIDAKTKELMALAIGIAVHCDGCVAYHTKMAHETIALAVYMGGGPAAVYGADAARAYDQFSGKA